MNELIVALLGLASVGWVRACYRPPHPSARDLGDYD